MSTPILADVYEIVMAGSEASERFVAVYETWLGPRHFLALVREEAYDHSCTLPATEAPSLEAAENMVWAEVVGDDLQPLIPGEAEILEELFQGRLTTYCAKLLRG